VGVGLLFITNRRINKTLVTKTEKHERLTVLTEAKLDKISKYFSVALDDGDISNEEFRLILLEIDDFTQKKQQIRAKTVDGDKQNKIVELLTSRVKQKVEIAFR